MTDDQSHNGTNDKRIDDDAEPGWPWSFLLLVFAGAAYLIFRFVQLAIGFFG
jgi:hypothetical protein